MFRAGVREAPEDADLHTVLGVLFNLSREYDLAIDAFRQALQLKPKNYSLVRDGGSRLNLLFCFRKRQPRSDLQSCISSFEGSGVRACGSASQA